MVASLGSRNMRVLHLCDSLNPAGLGGYESYLHYLSGVLDQAAHESIITTQKPSHNSTDSIEAEHYQIRYLEGNMLEARKWEYLTLPQEERHGAVKELFAPDDLEMNIELLVTELLSLIEDFRPDVVHAHSTYVVFNRVLEHCRHESGIERLPLVATIHGLPKPLVLPDGTETTDFEQLAAHCPFDTVLGVSDCVTSELQSHLPETVRDVRREYLGIDLDVFQPGGNPKQWDLAFMGRMERMKSVDMFPALFGSLIERYPSLNIVMTGEGSCRRTIMEEFSERGLDRNIDYLGVVPNDEVPSIIGQSKVFLYPSRREPFGLSIVEAMACQVPVVASNVFGPKEIITHNTDGILVHPNRLHKIAESVLTLLGDFERRTSLGISARRTIQRRFNIQDHAKRLVNLYGKLISGKKE